MHPPVIDCTALATAADGSHELAFVAGPGLYQFSVTGDASEFDWETMYVELRQWGNQGERTGPWDFDPTRGNVPVVPSYWVELDGRRLGLWFFQRLSAEDIAARCMHGNTVVHVDRPGRHVLRFIPYSEAMRRVRWLAPVIEPDPLDALDPLPFALDGWEERSPFGRLAEPAWWEALERRLRGGDLAAFLPAVERSCDWVEARISGAPVERLPGTPDDLSIFTPHEVLSLIVAYRLRGNREALQRIRAYIERVLAAPHWGNQREDGYGCDGDGASHDIRATALAFRALRHDLDAPLRERLRERLRSQCQRFFELSLLHRDFWGGSVLQGHGWVNMANFASGVLHLLGAFPEAGPLASYAVHRMRRAFAAMPRDGILPPSVYSHLFLYLDPVTVYRDTLVALTGEDPLRHPAFAAIPGYLAAILRPADHRLVVPVWGAKPLSGGTAGLNRLAAVHGDGVAAALCLRTLASPPGTFGHEAERTSYLASALTALLAPEAMPAPAELPPPPLAPLCWWRDGGVVQYRDPCADVTLTLSCGPWCGFHAYRASACSCDRLDMLGGAGHFIITDGAENAVVSPDGGYALASRLRNVLLIDGQGRHGDLGYPMSIPGFRHRGEQVEIADWDEAQGAGLIRLDLAPAYPAAAGVIDYRRDFAVRRGGIIVIRDRVVLDRPRALSWLFHAAGADAITDLGGSYRFGRGLVLTGALEGAFLSGTVRDTPTVRGYSSPQMCYRHVRFDADRPVAVAQAQFTFSVA